MKLPSVPLSTVSQRVLLSLIAKADAESFAICDAFISAGRGYERPSVTRFLSDPLALRWKEHAAIQDALRDEAKARKEWHGTLKPIRRKAVFA